MGVRPETFGGRTEDFTRIVHPDDAEALWAKVRVTVETGARLDHEFRIIRPDDGRVRWIINHARMVGGTGAGAGGEPARLIGTMRDVSDRHQSEEALAASEREFRAIFELANSGKGQADPATGRFTRVNRKFCEITGYPEHELLGRTITDITHPDDRADDRETMAALLAGRVDQWLREKRYVRRDGSVVWVSVSGSAIRDAEGRAVRLVATVQDVSERKRAEEAARVACEQAEAANKAKDHFLAVLSHELRTPLTPVVMTLAGLEMDRSLSQGVRDDLAMIRRNVELETKLIDDLLDVTRIANGKLRLHPQPADAHALVAGVGDLFQSEARTKRLELRLELGAADARVSADAARLQQVFWNLVRNAIKFTPERGHVLVRTSNPRPHTLRVEVADSGIGIEDAALPRLFNAFEQAETSITRKFGGLGLGLAISKALVDLHGGTIRAQSAGRGRGATFTVELPTVGQAERLGGRTRPPGGLNADDAAAGTSGAPALRAPAKPLARVLLVEDHADTLRILKRLLERMGYAVVTASSTADALNMLANETVDVIVSDIGLPDGTGHELIRKVKANSAHAGLPAIAISGFGMDADVRNSRDAGFVAHMTKPVDVRQLDAAIRSAVNAPGRSPT
jgi:two-component system CheB/CheR fusion protein